jgi:hypothetical protein
MHSQCQSNPIRERVMTLEDKHRLISLEVFNQKVPPLHKVKWFSDALLLGHKIFKFFFSVNAGDNFAAAVDVCLHIFSALLFEHELAEEFDHCAADPWVFKTSFEHLISEALRFEAFAS